MENTQIRNVSIIHESDGQVDRVLINGEDLNNIIIRHTPNTWTFEPFRPDNSEISFSREYVKIFHDIFTVIDELFCSNRGCLAAYLSSYLYERLTPIWRQLLQSGKHIMAIQYWKKFISITHEWEKRNSKHIHKGSPYAFIAYTYLLIGDIDTGFSYIYNAIEEDITLNLICPRLDYPSRAPVYLTASLSSSQKNIMYPLVEEMRSELENFLCEYRKSFRTTFDLKEFDKKFLQNIDITTIKYYFAFNYWTIFEYRRKVGVEMMQNEFSKLKNVDWMFSLCLVIDKLLNYKYNTKYMSDGIKEYSRDTGLMAESQLNSFLSQEKISSQSPDLIIPKLISTNLLFNNVQVCKELKYLLIAYNLRNFASHNIETQNVIVNEFEQLIKILLCDIFLIVEKL